MLIVGAKGFAKEVLEIFRQNNDIQNLLFFDDVTKDIEDSIFGFKIIKSINLVELEFKNDPRFTLGIGNPKIRYMLFQKMISLGGEFTSTISTFAHIGHYDNIIENGCNIMTGVIITNSVKISKGVLLNINSNIGHDSEIGQFTEVSPGVSISGNCKIGEFCNIGTNATILPKVKVGKNVTIGAGAVVTKDVNDGETVVGIPAKPLIKK
jgi:sugar O-acyltransferase (sialic acid O-acetyltransferase NeuD family)